MKSDNTVSEIIIIIISFKDLKNAKTRKTKFDE